MNFFRQSHLDLTGLPPDNRALQFEACRIVFASAALSDEEFLTTRRDDDESWLRDLIMSNSDITTEALFGPLRTASEGISTLRIYGRNHLFEQCPLEAQLRAFAQTHADASFGLPDWRLQQEACEIIRHTEEAPSTTPEGFADWAIQAIGADSAWLSSFKQRVGLHSSDQTSLAPALPPPPVSNEQIPAAAPTEPPLLKQPVPPPSPKIPSEYSQSHRSMGPNFFRLFTADLKRWVLATMSASNPGCHVPSDAEIQHHARWIMYECDDPWNQTAADHPEWLWRFKRDVGIVPCDELDLH